MIINVKRFEFGTNYTVGKLSVDGTPNCYTLEDKVRESGIKVHGATAIPIGTYKVVIDMSTRFGRLMPHLLDVPGFTGIRIHPGNTSANTEGCLLVGLTWSGSDFIGSSRLAFNALFDKIKEALDSGESCSITIN